MWARGAPGCHPMRPKPGSWQSGTAGCEGATFDALGPVLCPIHGVGPAAPRVTQSCPGHRLLRQDPAAAARGFPEFPDPQRPLLTFSRARQRRLGPLPWPLPTSRGPAQLAGVTTLLSGLRAAHVCIPACGPSSALHRPAQRHRGGGRVAAPAGGLLAAKTSNGEELTAEPKDWMQEYRCLLTPEGAQYPGAADPGGPRAAGGQAAPADPPGKVLMAELLPLVSKQEPLGPRWLVLCRAEHSLLCEGGQHFLTLLREDKPAD
eukprot:bmy_22300T0